MVIQTAWIVTEGDKAPGDADEGHLSPGGEVFAVPPNEHGVLHVERVPGEREVFNFAHVFPAYTTREAVFNVLCKEAVGAAATGRGTSCCTVLCGVRTEGERLGTLFGKVPLSDQRTAFTDGLAMRAFRELFSLTPPHSGCCVKFSLSCLKESGVTEVDLLKNLRRDGPEPPVSGEQHYIHSRYLVSPSASEFVWAVNKVLQSPSFVRLSSTLTLLLACSIYDPNTCRETTVSFLDLSPHHLTKYGVLENLARWKRLAAPDPSVPELLTYPLRSSARVVVAGSHPPSLGPDTGTLLRNLHAFSASSASPNPPPPPPPPPLQVSHAEVRFFESHGSVGRMSPPPRPLSSPSPRKQVSPVVEVGEVAVVAELQRELERCLAEKVRMERELEEERELGRERHEAEAETRIRMREAQLSRQHESQLAAEHAARRRIVTELETQVEALSHQLQEREEAAEREIARLGESLHTTSEQLEHRTAEVARLKAAIPEARRDEARKVTSEFETEFEKSLRDLEKQKRELEAQLEGHQREFEAEMMGAERQIEEHAGVIEQLHAEREEDRRRFKDELDSLRETLQTERVANEEHRLREMEQLAAREGELGAETSRIRAELAKAQAESLKSSRLVEAKEMEIQALNKLANEMEAVRSRNTELERLLRENQHYGKSQQMKRDLETSTEVMEQLRTRLIPSWCPDWSRLGRLKDLREHLLSRAEELMTKLRSSEVQEREQRMREVALVTEHESAVQKMNEHARRAAVLEAKHGEVESDLAVVEAEHRRSRTETGEMRRILEAVAAMLLPPSPSGEPALGSGWVPSLDVEVWLTNALRQLKFERDKFRDAESDKTHQLQELEVRYSQLQAENDIVNQNVKEMTNQIIGCSFLSSPQPKARTGSADAAAAALVAPPQAGRYESYPLDSPSKPTAALVAPPSLQAPVPLEFSAAARNGSRPSTPTRSQPCMMLSPFVPPAPAPASSVPAAAAVSRSVVQPAVANIPAPAPPAPGTRADFLSRYPTLPRSTAVLPTSPAVPLSLRPTQP